MPCPSHDRGWQWAASHGASIGATSLEPLHSFTGGRARRAAAGFLELTPAAQVVSCRAQGSDLRFQGPLARVVCPAHCQREPRSVAYGASIHPMRSSVCLSAIVDRVMPLYGGEVMVTKVPGLPSYKGADVNFAASLAATDEKGEAFHAYATDNIDLDPTFPAERAVDCRATFASLGMTEQGSSLPAVCPGDCKGEGQLAGTSIYSPGSSVCRAARHAGVIGSEGGHVMVTLGHGQDGHFGSRQGGDTSTDGPGSEQSYTVALPSPDVLSRARQPGAAFL